MEAKAKDLTQQLCEDYYPKFNTSFHAHLEKVKEKNSLYGVKSTQLTGKLCIGVSQLLSNQLTICIKWPSQTYQIAL
ncbi:hypothetical protein HMPREF9420_1398 [Segatella salivae DSM 15606]|uniref:Uncharacterized protein n=1 Tax=Segatella salivae DSM 15606 TaxID=888832 RepID=E6MPI0_9BACT|nr:hypothetical protein HMPREF9420_1398 [Segatella salivae DSM 15606]